MSDNTVIENTTCFEEHESRNLSCLKEECRNWMNCPSQLNCAVIASQRHGPRTLQEIGDIFGVTRMRICQIEKSVMGKLRDRIYDDHS